jgi:hypothetical protein
MMERGSSHKIAIGMALDNYKCDPKRSCSNVPPEIADDLSNVDAVRKWFKRAAEWLPG